MPNRAGRIPISGPGPATPNLDTLTTLGFGVPMADRRTPLEDAPSDSIRRTSQEGLSPKGWKLSIAARKATMPEPYQLKSKICLVGERGRLDRNSTRLNSSHGYISYAVFCLKKKKKKKYNSQHKQHHHTQSL